MPRKRSGLTIHTTPVREITLLVAVILWLVGFLSVILGVIDLPGSLGVWLLAAAGGLMIVASLVKGL